MEEVKRGHESLIKAIQKDCAEGDNCFNASGTGCTKKRHIYKPQDNPRLIEMGMTKMCVLNSKCFHDYCGKYKWVLERAAHYAEKLDTTVDRILEVWEGERSYWYMNFYQDAHQPMIEGEGVMIFDTLDEAKVGFENGFRCPSCNGISTDPYECSCEECDWKSYGLFGTLGKGVTIIIKDTLKKTHIFMPIAWEGKPEKVQH